MGTPPFIRSARLEKWAVSHGGLRTGCLAAKEDGVSVATQVHRAEHRRVQAGVKTVLGVLRQLGHDQGFLGRGLTSRR